MCNLSNNAIPIDFDLPITTPNLCFRNFRNDFPIFETNEDRDFVGYRALLTA